MKSKKGNTVGRKNRLKTSAWTYEIGNDSGTTKYQVRYFKPGYVRKAWLIY
jgi:hypothetical protein